MKIVYSRALVAELGLEAAKLQLWPQCANLDPSFISALDKHAHRATKPIRP